MPQDLPANGDESLPGDGRPTRCTPSFSVDDELRRNLPDERKLYVIRLGPAPPDVWRMRGSVQTLRRRLQPNRRHGILRSRLPGMRGFLRENGGVTLRVAINEHKFFKSRSS
jgi:hypothetical protein